MKKSLIILVLLGLSIMPALANVQSNMEKLMNGWVGEDINDVIMLWGKPSSVKETSNGTLYYWTDNNKTFSTANHKGQIVGIMKSCNRIFGTNKDNKIIDWQWDGNTCPGKYSAVKKLVNPKVKN